MSDEEPNATSLLFDYQALQLVVAQLLADRFALAKDPVFAHRTFTDRIHARIDAVQPLDPDDFERLNACLLHDGVDRVMGTVEATSKALPGPDGA
jgi:hypothetical protein